MDGAGMSLFQGAGSLHINNSAEDRHEEQEELEDQKRRAEEIKQKLANEFGDFEDDETNSVNSSHNYTMEDHNTNGVTPFIKNHPTRPGLPSYTESLNHLKDASDAATKQYCETPVSHNNNHNHHMHFQEMGYNYSPQGAGDGQGPYQNSGFRGHVNGIGSNQLSQQKKFEHLEVMYEIKVKECESLAADNARLTHEATTEIESLRARLEAALNDKQQAELSVQKAHELLASCKQQVIANDHKVATIEHRLVDSEREKEQMKLELQSAVMALQEEQQKLHIIKTAHSQGTDELFRQTQDRHRQEMDGLFDDLQKLRQRLEDKENEIKKLERYCKEKDKEKEQLLIDKSATVNRLASELETAQSRLVNGETGKLKEKVAKLTRERDTALQQVNEFGSKLASTTQELVMYRKELAKTQKTFEDWQQELQQIVYEHVPDKDFLGEPQSPGRLSRLKDVLTRYRQHMHKLKTLQEEVTQQEKKLEQHRKHEADLRSKLEEQKSVELQLNSRVAMLQSKVDLLTTASDSHLVDTYKQQNEELTRLLEEAKAKCKNLDLRNAELDQELDKLKCSQAGRTNLVQETNADLLQELEKYSAQLKDTLKLNAELKSLYLQACSTRDAMARELKDYQSKQQSQQNEKSQTKEQEREYIERLEKQRQQIDGLTSELSTCRDDLESANKRILELQKDFNDKQKDFTTKLNKYLEEEKSSMRKEFACAQCDKHLKTISRLEEQVNKFNVKLATQESNEELMKELRAKGEFFQQYIMERFQKLQEQRHVATNTDAVTDAPTDNTVERTEGKGENVKAQNSDDDDDFSSKTKMMVQEREIRDQIAQKYTLEIKTVEMNCTKRIKEIENEHKQTITKLKQLLETKAQEVETLKQFIIQERENITQILTSKENEISTLIKEHNSIQSEYLKLKEKYLDLKHKLEKYQEKIKLIEDRYKSDKESSRKSLGEVEKERDFLSNRVKCLESEYQELKVKYKQAKKTAYMYKEYITKKDEHTNNELSRIQNEYKQVFLKLEEQINYFVNVRVRETSGSQPDRVLASSSRAGEKTSTGQYTDVLNRLHNDIAALAQSTSNDLQSWSVK